MNNLIIAIICIVSAGILGATGMSFISVSGGTRSAETFAADGDIAQMMGEYQQLRMNLGARPQVTDWNNVYSSSLTGQTATTLNSTNVEMQANHIKWAYLGNCDQGVNLYDCFALSIPANTSRTTYEALQNTAKKYLKSDGVSSMIELSFPSTNDTNTYVNPALWPSYATKVAQQTGVLANKMPPYYITLRVATTN